MKNVIIVNFLIFGLLLSAHVVADDAKKPIADSVERKTSPRPPAHNPEWTDLNSGDPGRDSVSSDLQKIVVLCAKDHESPEFKRAWSAYVRKNKLTGARLDQTIQRVVNEAFRHRQEFGQSQGNRQLAPAWKSEASRSMHDTSKATIRNTKG